MHDVSLTPAARLAREGNADVLAQALQASRRDTLATFALYEQALPGLDVPRRGELNPPLWELGHIGWFQAHWLARFPAWRQGHRADPTLPRLPDRRPDADDLYNSSLVPHASRWTLPLPDADATREDLHTQLQATLHLLAGVDDRAASRDSQLYFFRLALLHEDMHHEAALYTARSLGIPVTDARWQARALPEPPEALDFEASRWRLGSESNAGFGFDNEFGAHGVAPAACRIDAQAVRWADYLPFAETGGYTQDRWWSEAGLAWRRSSGASAPRYLQRDGTAWQQWRGGRWQSLVMAEAACHLSCFEAEAWCRWAGRRLPSEAEWERAACSRPDEFRWGDAWEWTASPFAPYPGFEAHPYRDYSAPWFDGRPVLRGASPLTQPRLRHPRYRNYFPPHRNDVPAGFRSCTV